MYNFEEAKREYIEFCEKEVHDIQIFAQPWYLDAVCQSGESWRVIVYKENGKIVAAFPFEYKTGKLGMKYISNPFQAPRLGIWIDYEGKKGEGSREEYENRIVDYIISNLPPYDVFSIAFDSRFKNWQEFYRNGFCQTGYYSYMVYKDTDLTCGISKGIRKKIRALEKKCYIDENINADDYWDFFLKSYALRNRKPSYTKEQFVSLCNTALAHEACNMFACRDEEGKIIAVECVFNDARRVYDMFGTFDPTSSLSPTPLMTYHALKIAFGNELDFDFEGSMIKGVANYNMKFDGRKELYFVISDYSNKYRLVKSIKDFFKAVKNILKRK